MKGFLGGSSPVTVRQLISRLKAVYCGTVGYEYMHIQSRAQCNWIRERIETMNDVPLTKAEKLQLLDRLAYAEVRSASSFVQEAGSSSLRALCNVCFRLWKHLPLESGRPQSASALRAWRRSCLAPRRC